MESRARRLDDRIRELCAEAVAAKNSHKARQILAELQSAIHQYTHRLRTRAAGIFATQSTPPEERRKNARGRGHSAS